MKLTSSNWTSINAYLKLHLVVLIWGFTAILGKLISIPVVEVVFYRTLIAAVGLIILLKLKGINFKVDRTNLLYLLGTGVIIGGHWILFFLAARVSNVSICLAGMATTSLWTSIIEPMVMRRPFRLYEALLGLLAIVGISVVFGAVLGQSLGLILAVLSALLSAIFTIINGRLVRKHHHHTITMYEMVGACFITVIFMPVNVYFISGEPVQLAMGYDDLFFILILALVCTVYAYSLSVKLMETLSAFAVNLTVNMEPIYGIFLAFLIFGESERMGQNFYVGTMVILLSVLLYPFIKGMASKSAR